MHIYRMSVFEETMVKDGCSYPFWKDKIFPSVKRNEV
jgi:hypothetical protein